MLHDLAPIQSVILAGGVGRRLWPLSTPARPKPFLLLGPDGQSLLQATALRVTGMRAPLVVGNIAHRDRILRDLKAVDVKPGRLLLEPAGRGTAPALAVAAHLAGHREDPLLLVLPSDHFIDDADLFLDAVAAGVPYADAGAIVTFGITARSAATRYGYIRAGEALGSGAARIDGFVEKPAAARARDFLRAGGYYWNGGIFLLRARTALMALAAAQPALHQATALAVRQAIVRQESVVLDAAALTARPSISIDHAIMEGIDLGVVVRTLMGWSDLGTWPAVAAHWAYGRRARRGTRAA